MRLLVYLVWNPCGSGDRCTPPPPAVQLQERDHCLCWYQWPPLVNT
jgi:hypothetical protein